MAAVSSRISIRDGVSRPAMGMADAVGRLIDKFDQLQETMSKAFETSSFARATEQVSRFEETTSSVARRTQDNTQEQQRYNQEINKGAQAANKLLSRIKQGVLAYAGLRSVGKVINFSDEQVLIKARLELANDGKQSVGELEKMIMASAHRSRASYFETAASIAKLGVTAKKAFSGTDEIVAFSELLNKSFKISGASAQEQAAGVYQLTQAMASGRLQGDEFRSIIENAPLLAQAISDYAGVSQAKLKEMSSDGQISANLIKNALFASADEIENRFNQMPMTFRDIFTSMQNAGKTVFEPFFVELSKVANNKDFQRNLMEIIQHMSVMAKVGGMAIGWTVQGLMWLSQAWKVLKYPIMGVVASLAAYKAIMVASTVISALSAGWHTIQAVAIALYTGGTIAGTAAVHGLTVAQWALNASFLANPIFWIPAAILIVIGLFKFLIGVINRFGGTSYSAMGIAAGALWGLVAVGQNIVAYFFNQFSALGEFFANFLKHPLYASQRLFVNFAQAVINIALKIAQAIDAVFGSNLSSALSSFSVKMTNWAEQQKPEGYKEFGKMKSWSIKESMKKGYEWGSGFGKKNLSFGDSANGFDYRSFGGEMADNIAGTKDNTGKIKDKLQDTAEDLKYLRDLAEREVIDRTILRDVKVEVQNTFGDIRETADVDGIIDTITERLEEALESGGEG
ncbi:MAG: tape measure protein [Peptostreptococcaceae bacterium]|nr:tape measure protein [Peptostreptococcaceae bacterium]